MSTQQKTEGALARFLKAAYEGDVVHAAVWEGILRSSQRVADLAPIGAHITKDQRLAIAYRLTVASDQHYAQNAVPVIAHFCELSRVHARAAYAAVRKADTFGMMPPLKRCFARLEGSNFVSAFPCDPELKEVARLLRPDRLRAAYNRELREENAPPAKEISARLIGYRPERRAVLELHVSAPGDSRTIVAKAYRSGDAKRAWQVALAARKVRAHVPALVWPLVFSESLNIITYPHVAGESLHELLEQGLATGKDLRTAGELLRSLHMSGGGGVGAPAHNEEDGSAGVAGLSNVFTVDRELEVLERWRRLLKQGGHELAGTIAKVKRAIELNAGAAGASDALIHRDFYPKQLIVAPYTGEQRLIDLDTLAVGPAALDLGNFVAHLTLWSAASGKPAAKFRDQFLEGYGEHPEEGLLAFELSSTARLAALAAVGPEASRLLPALLRQTRRLMRQL